ADPRNHPAGRGVLRRAGGNRLHAHRARGVRRGRRGGEKMSVPARTPQEQTVLDFFRILSTGELEAIRKTLHADATWKPMVENIPGAGTYGPRDNIVDDFLGPVRSMFKLGDPKTTVDSIVSHGVFVIGEAHGQDRTLD